jgi:hypothetical protein
VQRPSYQDRTIRQDFEPPPQYRCGKKLRLLNPHRLTSTAKTTTVTMAAQRRNDFGPTQDDVNGRHPFLPNWYREDPMRQWAYLGGAARRSPGKAASQPILTGPSAETTY